MDEARKTVTAFVEIGRDTMPSPELDMGPAYALLTGRTESGHRIVHRPVWARTGLGVPANAAIVGCTPPVDAAEGVDIEFLPVRRMRVHVARMADIAGDPVAVHVDATTAKSLLGRRCHGLLIAGELSMPVIVRRDAEGTDECAVRVPLHLRELANGAIELGAEVRLQGFDFPIDLSRNGLIRALRIVMLRLKHKSVRALSREVHFRLDLLAERALRLVLNAPALPLRTVEAWIGDDSHNAVRLHESTMDLLGVQAGQTVELSWGPHHRVVARALTAPDVDDLGDDADRTTAGSSAQRLARSPHLQIGVPAPLRGELGIPRDAVVCVRRRLKPLALRRVNEAVLPIGGLLTAVIALDSLKGTPLWVVGVLSVSVLLIELLPLRVPR